MGEAYSGGVSRVVMTFDDSQVGELVASLAQAMDLDPSQIRELRQMGAKGGYHYELSLVSDAKQPIGLSLTVMDSGDEPVVTLSVGWTETEVSVVMGYGQGGRAYYDIYTLIVSEDASSAREFIFQARQMIDVEELGYPAASVMPEYTSVIGTLAVRSDERSDQLFVTGGIQHANLGVLWVDASGEQGVIGGRVSVGKTMESAVTAISWFGSTVQTEAVSLAVNGEKTISAEDLQGSGTDDVSASLAQGMADLLQDLVRVLPMEVLMLLMQLP